MAALDTFLAGLPAEVAHLFADATVLSALMALVKARRRKDPRRSQAEVANEVVSELLVPGSPFREMLDAVMKKRRQSGESDATAQMTAELGSFGESTNRVDIETTSWSRKMSTQKTVNTLELPLAETNEGLRTPLCDPPLPPPPPSPKLGSPTVPPTVNRHTSNNSSYRIWRYNHSLIFLIECNQ